MGRVVERTMRELDFKKRLVVANGYIHYQIWIRKVQADPKRFVYVTGVQHFRVYDKSTEIVLLSGWESRKDAQEIQDMIRIRGFKVIEVKLLINP